MNHQLLQYVVFARSRKMADRDIQDNLVAAGWDADQVKEALKAKDDALLMPPPPPGHGDDNSLSRHNDGPIAVVQQRTTRGLEYTIMFLAMGVTAISLGALLHHIVDNSFNAGSSDSTFASYAAAALIVSLPIFALLFLRLRRAEMSETALRDDPSRRHAVQITLVVAFLWGLFRLVTYIYSLLSGADSSGYSSNVSAPTGNLLHMLITVCIAGLIFTYYWVDEHHRDKA